MQVVDADEREIILHPRVDVDEHRIVADGERAHLIVEAGISPATRSRERAPPGRCGGMVARQTRIFRLSASRIIASSAESAGSTPRCANNRSLVPSISSTTSGVLAASVGPNRFRPSPDANSPALPALTTVIVCDGYCARRSPRSTVGYDAGKSRDSTVGAIETTPSVRLSPKATNFVDVSRGGDLTITVKLHAADCPAESRAWQETVVEPTANRSPDVSEHDDVTGARPLAVVGTPKLTGTSLPSTDVASAGAGHVIARTPPAGGVGAIGDLAPHPAEVATASATASRERPPESLSFIKVNNYFNA